MRWDPGYRSSDIEDRRGDAPYDGGGGGVPVFGLLSLAARLGWPGVIIAVVLGGLYLAGDCGGSQHAATGQLEQSSSEEELSHFVGFVFDDVQRTWAAEIPGYRKTKLVLYRQATRSGCGTASEQIGPFYCPRDNRVYLDLGFFDELRKQLGAPGEFAQAYVIAHEVGHHVQDVLGLLGTGGGTAQIPVELQADCLAGAWAQDANRRGELEVGDIGEAIHAAQQIGDDTLQKRGQGYVQPETWTHGSSAQRAAAFEQGYGGGPAACGVSAETP
jgi:predicted metalloprotease